jgi:hypothetical protein
MFKLFFVKETLFELCLRVRLQLQLHVLQSTVVVVAKVSTREVWLLGFLGLGDLLCYCNHFITAFRQAVRILSEVAGGHTLPFYKGHGLPILKWFCAPNCLSGRRRLVGTLVSCL